MLKHAQDHLFLSWIVAITASFLAVGVAGMFEQKNLMPILLSGTKGRGADEKEAMQAVMIELQTEEVATEVVEETTDVLEVPPPIDIIEPPLDLPELAEALVTEDVFVIPTPPRIENALRPIDPVPPKPKPQIKPAAKPTRSVAKASPSRGATGAAPTQGGSGGAGQTGTAASRGTFNIPRPTYPSSLKSMGVQGTVTLSISVGSSGRAESVSVIGSSGNSALDQFAASWVRRNGRGPAGATGRFTAPMTFRIN